MTKKQRTYNGRKGSLFDKWYWESWTAISKTMKLDHSSTPYTKINSRWIKDLDIRLKVTEPLEKNLCGTLFNIGLSNIFLDMSSEVTETKAKINKNYINFGRGTHPCFSLRH